MKIKMTALELIFQLAEGSTTPNTLQHISKIAKETIEAIKEQEELQPFSDMTSKEYLRGYKDAKAEKQPQQEPVAWAMFKRGRLESFWMDKGDAYDCEFTPEHKWEPLYTSPPQPSEFALKHRIAELEGAVIGLETQRTWANATTWRGLTIEDKKEYVSPGIVLGCRFDAMDWAEKRLKEKNT